MRRTGVVLPAPMTSCVGGFSTCASKQLTHQEDVGGLLSKCCSVSGEALGIWDESRKWPEHLRVCVLGLLSGRGPQEGLAHGGPSPG